MLNRREFALRSLLLGGATLLPRALHAQGAPTVFLSTQLRPLEEAQKVREVILKGYTGKVDFVVDEPSAFAVRVEAEMKSGKRSSSLLGALHGELQPLQAIGALAPLDDLAAKLSGRGIPPALMNLGKLGTASQFYIPWMQATYFMAASKQALPMPVSYTHLTLPTN